MFTTPRLRLTKRSDMGEVSVLGDYADGVRGRMAADKALASTDGSVLIDRMFTNGATQRLVRIPHNHDGWPITLEEARRVELDRARHLLAGRPDLVATPPLTRLEELAEAAGTQAMPAGRLGFRQREAQLEGLQEQVDAELMTLLKREALGRIAAKARPDGDLATAEEAMAKRARHGRAM